MYFSVIRYDIQTAACVITHSAIIVPGNLALFFFIKRGQKKKKMNLRTETHIYLAIWIPLGVQRYVNILCCFDISNIRD